MMMNDDDDDDDDDKKRKMTTTRKDAKYIEHTFQFISVEYLGPTNCEIRTFPSDLDRIDNLSQFFSGNDKGLAVFVSA